MDNLPAKHNQSLKKYSDLNNSRIITISDCLEAPSVNKLKKHFGLQDLQTIVEGIVSNGVSNFGSKYEMTAQQIIFFSKKFIELYGYESLDDLQLCLENAAVGLYGNINHTTIDPPKLFEWFKQHLEMKYEEKEKQVHRKKNTITEQVSQEGVQNSYAKMIADKLNANKPKKKTLDEIAVDTETKKWEALKPQLPNMDKEYLNQLLCDYLLIGDTEKKYSNHLIIKDRRKK